MFEREIREMAFVPRWSIVRTSRQQYLAEHTFFVAMYANDIGTYLGLDAKDMAALLQMALWHDMEEIFSGDLPGPAKRAGMGDYRHRWDMRLREWLGKIFDRLNDREGGGFTRPDRFQLLSAIVKLADYIDECSEMGSELSMGNANVTRIFKDSYKRVQAALDALRPMVPAFELQKDYHPFYSMVLEACRDSQNRQSRHTSVFETL